MARKMIVGSTFYFVIGVVMGMAMSMTENYTLSPVHAHINLLGWVSLALGGLMYHQFPDAARSRLGKWHFWLHMLGIPLMMAGLACMLLTGSTVFVALVSVGGVCVVVGTILFSINAVRHVL
ncbi:cytochrome-c oxidase [Paenibacillus ginsengarvi]|uniref:Cytochrome-c oxidase n=1 Tax=Paenibacillus ginsengarvi TaxID=400777 RepID=A0A3B0AZV6_9BACL|nr:cytochrome-c oxidase [Paenibacillus ginsengarvi]